MWDPLLCVWRLSVSLAILLAEGKPEMFVTKIRSGVNAEIWGGGSKSFSLDDKGCIKEP